jgi:hypothetical protein
VSQRFSLAPRHLRLMKFPYGLRADSGRGFALSAYFLRDPSSNRAETAVLARKKARIRPKAPVPPLFEPDGAPIVFWPSKKGFLEPLGPMLPGACGRHLMAGAG